MKYLRDGARVFAPPYAPPYYAPQYDRGGKRVRTSEKLGVRGLSPQKHIRFDPIVNCIEVILVNFVWFCYFFSHFFSRFPPFVFFLSLSFFFFENDRGRPPPCTPCGATPEASTHDVCCYCVRTQLCIPSWLKKVSDIILIKSPLATIVGLGRSGLFSEN